MIQKDLHLHPKSFSATPSQLPIRAGYGTALLELGNKDPRVVALTADLAESTQTLAFAKAFPDRFVEVGVAEQNMATLAAGLAAAGKIPFISSYATFSPGRNWEQIRTTASYNDLPVKIAGHHAGISVGPDGATHQATEDIALMRVIPNMTVLVPCDAYQAHQATLAAVKINGPVYIRFQRAATPLLTTQKTPFHPGKAQILWQGKKPDVVIFACGAMVYKAIMAAKVLESLKIQAIVANIHTIKPLDKDISRIAGKCRGVVVAEEHQVNGGLGGAIAELLAKENPMPMEFVGLQDAFGESGDPEELLNKYGMSAGDIVRAARKAVRRG